MPSIILYCYVNEFSTYLTFSQGFCIVFPSDKKQNAVTSTHSAHRKHVVLVKTKEKSKLQNQTPREKKI